MPFQRGHTKRGGRRRGTLNKLTGEARDVARHLLGDPEYQRSLRTRLMRGQAPRVELHLWRLAFGQPRAEPDEMPEERNPAMDLLEALGKLGDPNGQGLTVDRHDRKDDPVPPASAPHEANEGKN